MIRIKNHDNCIVLQGDSEREFWQHVNSLIYVLDPYHFKITKDCIFANIEGDMTLHLNKGMIIETTMPFKRKRVRVRINTNE